MLWASAVLTRRDGTPFTIEAPSSLDFGRNMLVGDHVIDNDVKSSAVSRKQLLLQLSAEGGLTVTMVGAAASGVMRRGGHEIELLVRDLVTHLQDGDVLYLHSTGDPRRHAFPFTVSLVQASVAPTVPPVQLAPAPGVQEDDRKITRDKWFEQLFGFDERGFDAAAVRSNFELRSTAEGQVLVSRVNGASFGAGTFSTPSLTELRACVGPSTSRASDAVCELRGRRGLVLEHIASADVFKLHGLEEYAGATFQAASQFNALEFAHPNAVPEDGVTIYVYDGTQGPACALAAPAATVVRNYFVPCNGQTGQTRGQQLNNLGDVLASVQGETPLVVVRNGYTSASGDGALEAFNKRLRARVTDDLLGQLRVAVHADVEVPWGPKRYYLRPPAHRQRVTQVYCSALSVGYSAGHPTLWEPLGSYLPHDPPHAFTRLTRPSVAIPLHTLAPHLRRVSCSHASQQSSCSTPATRRPFSRQRAMRSRDAAAGRCC